MSRIGLPIIVMTASLLSASAAYARVFHLAALPPDNPPTAFTLQYQSAAVTTILPSATESGVGFATVVLDLNASDTGSIQISSSDNYVSSFATQSIVLGALGYADLTVEGLQFSISSGPIAVNSTTLLVDNSSSITLTLVGGTSTASNIGGVLASLVPDPSVIDFSVTPMSFDLSAADPTTSLTASVRQFTGQNNGYEPFLNLDFDITIPLLKISETPIISASLSGQITYVNLPEARTTTMLGAAGVILYMVKRTRRRPQVTMLPR